MTIIYSTGYTVPGGELPLNHARIGHSNNWLSGGTATASSTDADYFEDGPLDTMTYEKWKPTAVPATWEYEHTGSATCDYCGVAAHTLAGRTVQVQRWNGSAWVDLTPATVVADNSPLMFFFPPVSATRWRLNISAGAVPEVGVVKFGRALQMHRPIYGGHTPLNLARQTEYRSNVSETGQFLGKTKVRTVLSTSYAWSNLPAAWVRTNWAPLQKAAEENPMFIAWRPSSFDEVGYCMVDATPVPTNIGTRDLMSVEMAVKGLAYD